MPEAELNITTKHDGTQAEGSIKKLESKLDNFAKNVSGKISSAFVSLFGVEKVIQFAKAVDSALVKTAELVDKIREGKATTDDLAKTGISNESAGFASSYKSFRDSISPKINEAMIKFGRFATASSPLQNPLAGLGVVFSKDFRKLWLDSVKSKSNVIGQAFDAGNIERERQSTIEYIQRMSGETPLGKNQPRVSSEMLTVQKTQLQVLQEISKSLNPQAAELLERKTIYPR